MPGILLVEPNRQLAQSIQKSLLMHFKEVDFAQNGQSAIHKIDETMPGVIVLEVQMVGHNGIEFLHELRSYSEWQHIPVILHTVLNPEVFEGLEPALAELGVTKILYKPTTTPKQLTMKITEALGIKK